MRPSRIHGNHALAHGIERRHGARLLRDFGRDGARHHFQRGQQQRRLAGTVDHGARQLHARDLALPVHELDFVTLRGGFSANRRRKLFSTNSTYSGATNSVSGRPTTSADFSRAATESAHWQTGSTLRCTSTASCTVSTNRWNSCSRSCSCAPRSLQILEQLLTAAPSLPSAPGLRAQRYLGARGAVPR